MKIKRFFASDSRKAMRLVKEDLGPDAIIISNRQRADGVEIIAAEDFDEELLTEGELDTREAAQLPEMTANKTFDKLMADQHSSAKTSTEAETYAPPKASPPGKSQSAPLLEIPPQAIPLKSRQQKPRVSESEQMIDSMRQEILNLRGMMESQFATMNMGLWAQNSPTRSAILKQMTALGLSDPIASQLVGSLKNIDSVTPKVATRDALALLAKQIKVTGNKIMDEGGIIVLIGPAGAGKTTTIAKIAGQYIREHGNQDIILVSTDANRIGAHEQLMGYGRLLGVPVLKARGAEEINQIVTAVQNKALVLVDSGSLTQQEMRNPASIASFQTGIKDVKHYLILPATTQHKTLDRVVSAFTPVANYLTGTIITKVDEAASLGGALSAALVHKLPIAYWTEFPDATSKLHPATPLHLVEKAVAMLRTPSPMGTPQPAGMKATNFHNPIQ